MFDLQGLGRFLAFAGFLLLVAGLALMLLGRLGGLGLGRLPGDVVIERRGFVLYFPIATSLVLSVVLTIVLNFLFRR